MDNIGINVLSTVLSSPVNAAILDREIYEVTATNEEYVLQVYDTVGEILVHGRTANALAHIIKTLREKRFGWYHPRFDATRKDVTDEDTIFDSLDIEEGVIQCGKCSGTRTISYQRQTRSADEGATTFARCIECKTSWRHNN